MSLPKNISPCPILEAIFEIRFDSNLPGDAIFGIVYNCFKDEYPVLEKLPILQLPEQIRTNDPALMYSPGYRLRNTNYIIQIGQKVINIVKIKPYDTWTAFLSKITSTFNDISALNVVDKINRISLKYINLFDEVNIINNSNLSITLSGENFDSGKISLETQVNTLNCSSILKILTNAEVIIENKKQIGSIIDIDSTLIVLPKEKNCKDLDKYADRLHTDTKNLFYKLLSPKYIDSLLVTY